MAKTLSTRYPIEHAKFVNIDGSPIQHTAWVERWLMADSQGLGAVMARPDVTVVTIARDDGSYDMYRRPKLVRDARRARRAAADAALLGDDLDIANAQCDDVDRMTDEAGR